MAVRGRAAKIGGSCLHISEGGTTSGFITDQKDTEGAQHEKHSSFGNIYLAALRSEKPSYFS